jgi:alkylation response protein AidB-like acyl-CoA dehydrogenase
VAEIEASAAALERVAQQIGQVDEDELLARTLLVRTSIQNAIQRASVSAVELLGGITFIRSPEIAYLLAAAQALGFHPPSRRAVSEGLIDYLGGGELSIA